MNAWVPRQIDGAVTHPVLTGVGDEILLAASRPYAGAVDDIAIEIHSHPVGSWKAQPKVVPQT